MLLLYRKRLFNQIQEHIVCGSPGVGFIYHNNNDYLIRGPGAP